jgi:putative endonuclease
VPVVPASRHRPRSGLDRRRALGLRGEQLAAEHLQRLGYDVLARNVRTRHGEIDIIARDRAVLVFVEVKTRRERSPEGPVEPLSGIHPLQRLRLRRLAGAWLAAGGGKQDAVRFTEIRFDAVGVTVDGAMRLLRLDHIEAAW